MTLTIGGDPASITIDPDGVARVGGTRVTLDTVVGAFEQGATPEEIALRYDTLQLADVYAAIAYYLKHRAEVDHYLAKRRLDAERVRREPDQGAG
jgi:uncharacterized protein (DUF433 family)